MLDFDLGRSWSIHPQNLYCCNSIYIEPLIHNTIAGVAIERTINAEAPPFCRRIRTIIRIWHIVISSVKGPIILLLARQETGAGRSAQKINAVVLVGFVARRVCCSKAQQFKKLLVEKLVVGSEVEGASPRDVTGELDVGFSARASWCSDAVVSVCVSAAACEHFEGACDGDGGDGGGDYDCRRRGAR